MVSAEVKPPPTDEREETIVAWLTSGRALNLEALRSAVYRLCRAGHSVRLAHLGRPREDIDACVDPRTARPSF